MADFGLMSDVQFLQYLVDAGTIFRPSSEPCKIEFEVPKDALTPELLQELQSRQGGLAELLCFVAAELAGRDDFDRATALAMTSTPMSRVKAAFASLTEEQRERAQWSATPLLNEISERIELAFKKRGLAALKTALAELQQIEAICERVREGENQSCSKSCGRSAAPGNDEC